MCNAWSSKVRMSCSSLLHAGQQQGITFLLFAGFISCKFLLSDLESLIGASTVGLKYVSETLHHWGVRVEAGELLEPNGGWQPKSRIYSVVAKREIATADIITTDVASHIADGHRGKCLFCYLENLT